MIYINLKTLVGTKRIISIDENKTIIDLKKVIIEGDIEYRKENNEDLEIDKFRLIYNGENLIKEVHDKKIKDIFIKGNLVMHIIYSLTKSNNNNVAKSMPELNHSIQQSNPFINYESTNNTRSDNEILEEILLEIKKLNLLLEKKKFI